MICEGEQADPELSGNLVTYEDSICNYCRKALKSCVAQSIGLPYPNPTTFNWES